MFSRAYVRTIFSRMCKGQSKWGKGETSAVSHLGYSMCYICHISISFKFPLPLYCCNVPSQTNSTQQSTKTNAPVLWEGLPPTSQPTILYPTHVGGTNLLVLYCLHVYSTNNIVFYGPCACNILCNNFQPTRIFFILSFTTDQPTVLYFLLIKYFQFDSKTYSIV